MIKKRIIAVTLVMALTLAMLPTAHAVNPIDWVQSTLWDVVHDSWEWTGSTLRQWWDNTGGAFLDGFNGTEQQAYDDYVQHVTDTIGAPIVGKNGYIIPLSPNPQTAYNAEHTEFHPAGYPNFSTVITTYSPWDPAYNGFDAVSNLFSDFSYTMPHAGTVWLDSEVIDDGTFRYSPSIRVTQSWGNTSTVMTGTVLSFTTSSLRVVKLSGGFSSASFRAWINVIPHSFTANGFTSPIGGSGSRLTNTGINVIGSDNTIYENVSFVDETNNTFYNPTTNTTTAFENWQYDYSTREYTLTTSDNKQITIRYGDDSVVYKEGDTIVYNYYYALPDTPAPTPTPTEPTPTPPAPTAHVHSWVKSNDASFGGSCMTGAVDEYFCADANCTETHSITYAAAGHVWIEKQVVLTTYDENGEILQNGYVIFQCKACGEEYRSDNGQAPPTGGGNGHAGSRNIFEIMFGLLADFFGFFVNLLLDFIPNSLRDFFTSITDTSSDVFGIFETTHGGGQSNGSGAGRP